MRIIRGEIMDFECITTHKVKAQPIGVSDNDNLYSIFARCIGESIAFIWQWLKCFVLTNKKNLNLKSCKQQLTWQAKVLTLIHG